MARSFTALNLVVLPLLSSAAAVVLGHELLAVARRQAGLPPLVAPTFERLEGAYDSLCASRKYMDEVQGIDAAAAGEADVVLDANWGAFHSFLQGWMRVSSASSMAQAERARALNEGIFPEGLRFLTLPYKLEWAETMRRLDRLGDPDYDEHVKALGAEPFVEAIGEAFRAYGAALRLSERRVEGKATAKVREPLDRFVGALRSYVLHVATYASTGGEGSPEQALAAALLEPLANWPSKGGARKGKAAGEPEPSEGDEVTDAG
jgi:hypothetical protein